MATRPMRLRVVPIPKPWSMSPESLSTLAQAARNNSRNPGPPFDPEEPQRPKLFFIFAVATPKGAENDPDCVGRYQSDIFSLFGSLMIWAYYPSYNSFYAPSNAQQARGQKP
jgi:hypothetical protein